MGREGILAQLGGLSASCCYPPAAHAALAARIDALLDKKGNFGLRQFFARISQQLCVCVCVYVYVRVCVAATFNEH